MSSFAVVNIIGVTTYVIFFILLIWLSRVPRTRPGAGWWAIALLFLSLSRVGFLGLDDSFSKLTTESLYALCIIFEKLCLLTGLLLFVRQENRIPLIQVLVGIAAGWVVLNLFVSISLFTFAIGFSAFIVFSFLYVTYISIKYRDTIPRPLWLPIATISTTLALHWSTYAFLRFIPEWESPGFIVGNSLVILLYLLLIASVLMNFQNRLIEAEQKALDMAYHDPLTGLNNKRYMSKLFKNALLLATRPHQFVAIIYIDLDNFKPINDTAGHLVGDQVLIAAANRLLENTRSTDICARIGGDEFIVIATQLEDEKQVHEIATKLLEHLKKDIFVEGEPYKIGASIGISLYPIHGKALYELMEYADKAMYEVKNSGKCGYHVFEKEIFQN